MNVLTFPVLVPAFVGIIFLNMEYVITDQEFTGVKLGDKCSLDKHCQLTEPNSQCITVPDQQYHSSYVRKCVCKTNYRLQVVEKKPQCILAYVVDDKSDSGDFTATPIIFCFLACIIVEVVCLFGFRYWKKHRMRREFRLREYHGQTTFSACVSTCRSAPLPIVTFSILRPLNPVLSGVGPTSPSSYISNGTSDNISPVFAEDCPPSYEEVEKFSVGMPNLTPQVDPNASEDLQKDTG